MDERFIHLILEKLDNIKQDGHLQYAVNCIYCGISKHNRPHLGINFEKGVFHCFRCGESGTIYKLAKDLGINPKYLQKIYKQNFSEKDYNYTNLQNQTKKTNVKLFYFKSELTKKYLLARLKIDSIFEIYNNFVNNYHFGEKNVKYLVNNEKSIVLPSICFLSYNEKKLFCRAPVKERLHKIITLGKDDKNVDFPTILKNEEKITNIVFCEGIFDGLTYHVLSNKFKIPVDAIIITGGKFKSPKKVSEQAKKSFSFGKEINLTYIVDLDVKKSNIIKQIKSLNRHIDEKFSSIRLIYSTYGKDLNESLLKLKSYQALLKNLKLVDVNI